MQGLNPSIAYPVATLAPGSDPATDEGEWRLALLRPALRLLARELPGERLLDPASPRSLGALLSAARTPAAGASVLESVLSQTAARKPRIRLDTKDLQLLDPLEADVLDEATRLRCIAIENSKHVALPAEKLASPQVVVTFATAITGGVREAAVVLERSGDDGVALTATGASGLRKQVASGGIARVVLDRLFAPRDAPQAAPQPCDGVQDYTRAAVADFLERVLRLHVLCSAAAPGGASRPLVVERCFIRGFKKRDPCHLSIRAVLHQSSAACVCSSHGLRLDGDACVQVDLETCGRWLQPVAGKMRCPCHRDSMNSKGDANRSVDSVCTERTGVKITCLHRGGKTARRGLCVTDVFLRPEQRRELEFVLVNALEFEGRTSNPFKTDPPRASEVEAHCDALCSKLGKRVRACHEVKVKGAPCAEEMLQRDVLAVGLLREGGVQRFKAKSGNVYLQRRNGVPLDDCERDLVNTHLHLFRKRPF